LLGGVAYLGQVSQQTALPKLGRLVHEQFAETDDVVNRRAQLVLHLFPILVAAEGGFIKIAGDQFKQLLATCVDPAKKVEASCPKPVPSFVVSPQGRNITATKERKNNEQTI
jgi:hypothetical protein